MPHAAQAVAQLALHGRIMLLIALASLALRTLDERLAHGSCWRSKRLLAGRGLQGSRELRLRRNCFARHSVSGCVCASQGRTSVANTRAVAARSACML